MSASFGSISTSSKESLVETTRSRSLFRAGIGGAGNYQKAKSTPAAPPLPANLMAPKTSSFTSGIGGAGNKHSTNERPAATYDEELRRSIKRNNPTVARSGIGGAGNYNKSLAPVAPEPTANRNEPLPYGAVDILARKISKVFSKSKESLESSTGSKSS